jgi:NNP family nitrate/nitrite transporter-like MFS transporter
MYDEKAFFLEDFREKMMANRYRKFWAAGHMGTLLTAFLYFDFTFAVWVLNGALEPFISEEFHLSPTEKGLMVSVPVIAGALLRFPFGLLSQYIGRKNAAQVEMGLVVVGLLLGYLFTDSYQGAIAMGMALGVAGASFGVALSLGSGWYPSRFKGLAMGIMGAGNSGAMLTVLFAPPLAQAFGWRAVYGLSVFPILLAMILLQIFAKEPPDREQKRLADYLKILVDRDVWVFNLMYAATFGGYIGLTSFLPTLFHDQYAIPKESIGQYTAVIILSASVLRIAGGWLADLWGGIRLLRVIFAMIIVFTVAASFIPSQPWVMVTILVLCFSAMGAGSGAIFQLVPLRFTTATAVAGSFIGEIGALAGGLLPNAMGMGKQIFGTFSPGFLTGTLLTVSVMVALALVKMRWTTTWINDDGHALKAAGTT